MQDSKVVTLDNLCNWDSVDRRSKRLQNLRKRGILLRIRLRRGFRSVWSPHGLNWARLGNEGGRRRHEKIYDYVDWRHQASLYLGYRLSQIRFNTKNEFEFTKTKTRVKQDIENGSTSDLPKQALHSQSSETTYKEKIIANFALRAEGLKQIGTDEWIIDDGRSGLWPLSFE